LWALICGELVPVALIVFDFAIDGHPIDHFFRFSRVTAFWWFFVAAVVASVTPLVAIVHALLWPGPPWWRRILWAASIFVFALVAVPLYCLSALRRMSKTKPVVA
jgi:hypothetical protein